MLYSSFSDFSYDSQVGVANLSTYRRSARRYDVGMTISPVNQWVAEVIARGSMSQAELARRLSKELRRDIDRAGVNKMTTGERKVSAEEMLAIESITGFPVPSPNLPVKVPLIDWVVAGKLAESGSQIPVEDVPLLAFADLGRGDFFALKVKGNSMDRVSPEGSVIVVNRADRTAVNGGYFVFAVRGETTYKRWHAGDPWYLDPYSWDAAEKPVFVKKKKDLEIVGRVRRTLLDL
jgi:SOS-response transcriptional repressor LexA